MAITTEKAERIAQEYQKTGFLNKSKALINAGYKESYANCGRRDVVYKNVHVIDAIERIRTKIEAKVEHNYEIAVNMLKKRIEWLDEMAKKGNVQAIQAQTALIRELDAITGLHKQIIITEPQQQELEKTKRAEYQRFIDFRLRQETA